jgi:phosphate transport system permease protein
LLTHGAAWLTLALLVGIIISLFVGAAPAIREVRLGFLWSTDWDPVQEKFGGLVMIYGTLMTSFIALLIAVPVSFGIALFLTEMSPGWLKRPLGIAIELLAAVPSIVYGMWGLLVFGPILCHSTCRSRCSRHSDGVPCSAPWSRGRRWASASCRPASSWPSW